jgi:hypothetical protein
MCFSAEASFAAAAALTLSGYATIKLPLDKRYLLIALTPFLFAIQQFMEGMLWLSTKDPILLEQYGRLEALGYLFFAFLFWPIWIPLSLCIAEQESKRKKWLMALVALGVIFFLMSIYVLFQNGLNEIKFQVFSYSIQYSFPKYPIYYISQHLSLILYFLATTVSLFVSSLKYIWLLGLSGFIGLIFAMIFYEATSISVWCFFAAWCSVFLYFVLRKECSERIIT